MKKTLFLIPFLFLTLITAAQDFQTEIKLIEGSCRKEPDTAIGAHQVFNALGKLYLARAAFP